LLKLFRILSLIFIFLFASCNEKSGGVFPLKENSSFNYINEAPRNETELIQIKVLSYKKENDYDYGKLSSNPYFGKKDEAISLKVNNETGEIFTDDGGKENLLIPEAKNLIKGYSWKYGEWNATVSSAIETVKTESQIFKDCIRIDYRLSITFNTELWIKPGIGIIKFAAYRTNPPSMSHTYYVLAD
jgi:hypothetical protein